MNQPDAAVPAPTASPSMSSQRIPIALAILTLLAVVLPWWTAFDLPGGGMDEGMLLVYPEQILHGKLPYRDFETFYGPGNLWTLAGTYSVFGCHIAVERTVGLLYRLFLAAGVFMLIRRWSLGAAVISTILVAGILLPTRLIAYAWLGGIACALWSILLLAGRPSPGRAMGAGLLAGIALLYRVDLGPAVILSAAIPFLALPTRQRWLYLGAVGLALLPLAVLALLAGPRVTFENLFLYPVFVTNPGRHMPFSGATAGVRALFLLHLGACVCNVVAGALECYRERGSLHSRLFLGAALLAAGLTPQAMQRADSTHVVVVVFLSIALLPVSLFLWIRRGRTGELSWPWHLIAPAAALGVLTLICMKDPALPKLFMASTRRSLSTDARPVPSIVVRDRSFPRPQRVAEAQKIVAYLEAHSKPGERLFVGARDLRFTFYNDTFYYHLLPWLTPATYFLEMNPLSANRPHSRMATDMASADWLILNRDFDHSGEPNASSTPGPDAPNEVVRQQFEIQTISDPFAVYRRRGAR